MRVHIHKLILNWSWTMVPALLAFALSYWSVLPSQAQRTSDSERRADPASFLPGDLDPGAASDARAFTDFPILWLGEEFQGFKLVKFIRTNYDAPKEQTGYHRDMSEDSISLIYGTCVPEDSGDGPSCVPPLSIVVFAPGTAPRPDQLEPGVASPITNVRGLQSRQVGTGTMLWAGNGVTITVHSNIDVRGAALASLRLADGPGVGLRDIGPGQDLSALGTVIAPAR